MKQMDGAVCVVLVEPDPERLIALASFLSRQEDLKLLGIGEDLVSALSTLSVDQLVDVLVIRADEEWSVTSEWRAMVRLLFPGRRIVTLAEMRDPSVLVRLMGAGAVGIHPHDACPSVLVEAVRDAAMGISSIDRRVVEIVKSALIGWIARDPALHMTHDDCGGASRNVVSTFDVAMLTMRERVVLARLADCMSNRQIASDLGVSARTVAFHISNILRKLGVSSRTQAARIMWELRVCGGPNRRN